MSAPASRVGRRAAVARFFRRRANRVALGLVALFVAIALAAPLLAPEDPESPGAYRIVGNPTDLIPRPPAPGVPLGTAPGQVDVYHLLIWGTRSALVLGLTVALLAGTLGCAVGLAAGYAGGPVELILMRASDAFLSFPALAGIWLLEQLLVDPSFLADMYEFKPTVFQLTVFQYKPSPLLLGLILFSWMPYARLIDGLVAALKSAEFVVAARAVGARPLRIALRHMLPNVLAPALVLLVRDVGGMVVLSAAFTFVGVGRGSEWGTLLVAGRDWIIGAGGNPLHYWWVYVPATVALVAFSAAWNLLGDGLNVWLDPRAE